MHINYLGLTVVLCPERVRQEPDMGVLYSCDRSTQLFHRLF